MLTHRNTDHAHAIRAARRETIRAASVLPPYGERFGDWLNSLSKRELYIYYTRMARDWLYEGLKGSPYLSRDACAREARKYLARAKGVRTGNKSAYVAQFGRRP